MIKIFVIILFCFLTGSGFCQKALIDSVAYKMWQSVEGGKIANDGSYVLYNIKNDPVGDQTLVVRYLAHDWELKIRSAFNAVFSNDSKSVIFRKGPDSIGICKLGNSQPEYISGIQSYKTSKDNEWIYYTLKGNVLIVRNVLDNLFYRYNNVIKYAFNENGRKLAIVVSAPKAKEVIKLIDLVIDSSCQIWQQPSPTISIGNIVFDRTGRQVVFDYINSDKNMLNKTGIYYYSDSTRYSIDLTTSLESKKDGLKIGNVERFSFDNTGFFLSFYTPTNSPLAGSKVKLDISSYLDQEIESGGLRQNRGSFKFFFNIRTNTLMRLEFDDEFINLPYSLEPGLQNDNYVIITKRKGSPGEANWNKTVKESYSLLSIHDATTIPLTTSSNSIAPFSCSVSPLGRFVIYYDFRKKNYFSYEILTGITRNLTGTFKAKWTKYNDDHINGALAYYPIAGWSVDDSFIFLYDQFDIWKVDPRGAKHPVNITNQYGIKSNIEFRFLAEPGKNEIIDADNDIKLIAYNRLRKTNGFYIGSTINGKDPQVLSMGAYLYYVPNIRIAIHGTCPVKAKDSQVYLVQRMSATQSPNYFTTIDFTFFNPVSNVYPEKNYNWLQTELITWNSLTGDKLQGVLFKPENFDPHKKYPLLIYHYEKLSDGLNAFIRPQNSGGSINIPSYTSDGYLVFTPDIIYRKGKPGQSAYNAVISATNFLKQKSFVDSKRIGIQGHSFGGYETNYLVTHSNLFSAACSAAGASDLLSYYGQLYDGNSSQEKFETGQYRIGETPWQNRDAYLSNSPILNIDKVTSPLLIMHNRKDDAVPFTQGMELYTALRRMGKKSWLLDYEDGGHGVNGKAAEDFTVRMKQFFDHYLKDAPAPIWMTRGIPAKLKGIETGLEYDAEIKTPPESPLIENSKTKKGLLKE